MRNYGEYKESELKKIQKVLTEMLKDVNYICEKYDIKYFTLDGTGLGAIRHKGFIPWDDDIDIRILEEDIPRFIECVNKEMSDKYYFIDNNNSNYPIAFIKLCKRGTLFIDEAGRQLGEKTGIFIDVFPMVYASEDEKIRTKALNKSWIYYKLGTIAALKNPIVPFRGFKGKCVSFAILILHYIFKLFRVSSRKLFKKADKIARTTDKKTNIIVSFNTVVKNTCIYNVNDIFPVKKAKFEDTFVYVPKNVDKLLKVQFGDYMKLPPKEKRHNHYPYRLEFEYEEK